MSRRRGGFVGGYDGLSVPDAPTIGAATAGDSQVSVAFTAPTDVGDDPITEYAARVTDGTNVFNGTASSSPITVTGLTNGTSYTAQVWAINDYGNGPLSASTSSFSPLAPRAIYGGGRINAGSPYINVIQYVDISSNANAQDFGDLTVSRAQLAASGNSTRSMFFGGTD